MSVSFSFIKIEITECNILSVENVHSCTFLSESILNHQDCHTFVKIPLTSLILSDFLLWCSQRADKHTLEHQSQTNL